MERAAVFVIPASFVSYHFFGRDQVSAGSGSHGVAPQSGTGTWVEFPKIPTLSPSQLRARRRVVENSYGQGTRMARGSAARMATVSAKPELSSKVLCKGTARAYVNDVPFPAHASCSTQAGRWHALSLHRPLLWQQPRGALPLPQMLLLYFELMV